MPSMEAQARAKLNLSLDILGKRPDGYHQLRMVMQSVTLADRLRVEIGTHAPLRVSTGLSYLPNNEKNLAAVAALRFQEHTGLDLGGVSIDIEKRIPVCAGLAGGSSDAAAVLRALNSLTGAGLPLRELCTVAGRVGSDVPYCVLGCTALAQGRGEELTPLPPLPPCWVVLCKPPFPISTPTLFARVDSVRLRVRPDTPGLIAALEKGDLPAVARRMYNVFEDALSPPRRRAIVEIKSLLIGHGALGASMSGSGPTVFGLFGSAAAARAAVAALRPGYDEVFLCQTV